MLALIKEMFPGCEVMSDHLTDAVALGCYEYSKAVLDTSKVGSTSQIIPVSQPNAHCFDLIEFADRYHQRRHYPCHRYPSGKE